MTKLILGSDPNFLTVSRRLLGTLAVIALAMSLGGCMRVWTWGDRSPPATATEQGQAQAQREQVAQSLAPTGVLRVGVYSGSPTSLVTVQGERRGIAFELGHLLGRQLGVPVQIIEFPRVAEVVDAVQDGRVDFTFTNASADRAKRVDFTPTLLRLELGVLVPQGSPIKSANELDQAGLRLGVTQGSSSQAVLGQRLKLTRIVPQASLVNARQALSRGDLDAFATNKGILFELADQLPSHRVLEDAWGFEQLAIAVPQGRSQAMPWLQDWSQGLVRHGEISSMARRAGLRGLAP
jgi:polar amino acid transport system substrate-binding protein